MLGLKKKRYTQTIAARYLTKRLKWTAIIFLLVFILFITVVLATFIGPTRISIWTVSSILLSKIPGFHLFIQPSWQPFEESIVLFYRLPRVVLAAVVGSSLSIAGAAMQGIFRNPMADPYIIGISSGAGLGACVAILFGISTMGFYTLPVFAFLGAFITAFTVLKIAQVGSRIPVDNLLLVGIAVGSFLSACIGFIIYYAGQRLHGIIFWLMGGLSGANWFAITITAPVLFICVSALYGLARDLNVFQLGEEEAQHLGVDVEKSKKLILLFSVLVTAVSVAFVGIIGFVGLIIPHLTRIFVGPDHRILLPACALVGAVFLIWADTAARSISPEDFPVGMVTAFCGAPFFLYLLRKRKRSWKL